MAPMPGSLVPSLVRRMSPAILYILKRTLRHKKDIISAASAHDDTFEALTETNKLLYHNDFADPPPEGYEKIHLDDFRTN